MSLFTFLFVNPVALLINLSALEILLVAWLFKLIGKSTSSSVWRILGCIVICIVLITITFKLLFTKDYRSSQVDISPVAELSSEKINRVEGAIERFREFEYITRCDIGSKDEDQYLTKTCTLNWRSQDPKSLLDISVFFYSTDQGAIKSLHYALSGRYIHVENDNNTEALLFDSRMIRSSDTLYISDSKRYVMSKIRIGNAIITLSEHQEYYNLDRNISTDFIKQLCDMLEDEE